jgi:DNA-binding transcriptional LysR family regulator
MRRRKLSNVSPRITASLLLGGRITMTSLIQTLAVAEYLNFRHAANALGVSMSSVSVRVKTLEEDLGILLFERHARGVRLTEAGRHFVELVGAGVDQLDHAVKAAGMAASGKCGRLRIGVHALIPGGFLAELIERYREDHSCIAVEIAEGTARDAVSQLRADRLDVVFVAGVPELPDCHTRQIWTEPLLAVLAERHRLAGQPSVTWADLAGETFIVRHGGTGPQVHDHIVLRLAGRWPAPSIIHFDVERGTLLSMVGQGFGVTIVGAATALLPTSGVIFLPITDEPAPAAFSAVWSPFNQGAVLRNLLTLASEMGRTNQAALSRRDSPRSVMQQEQDEH